MHKEKKKNAADGRPGITVNRKEFSELYQASRHAELSGRFLEVLTFLSTPENTFRLLTRQKDQFINIFVKDFLYYFTQEDFAVPRNHWRRYVLLNHVISNIVAMSDFGNTDPFIRLLLKQKDNLVKLLALYSRRNEVSIDYNLFFKTNPKLASLWYWTFFTGNTVTKTNYSNTLRHISHVSDIGDRLDLPPYEIIAEPYFRSTYADPKNDRKIKQKINELIRTSFRDVKVKNRPDRKKIAIISGKWFPQSAVYKTQYDYVRALASAYELTLINLTYERNDLHAGMFKDVRTIRIKDGKIDLSAVQDNDFGLVYFPDVGMHPESIYLANLRLAPIQVTQYGHPVSTFGSEIDYFIGGRDTELRRADNYSERLVLIPGLGQHPVYPEYTFQDKRKETEDFIISCTWSAQKINYPMLFALKKIAEQSDRKVVFRFFTGGDLQRWNFLLPSIREISSVLGRERTSVYSLLPYREYMSMLEESDLCLDSYPFGGCNTIVDCLYVRKPVIALLGTKAYNRLASVILKKLGLEELIAKSRDEYIATAVRMVNDDEYRKGFQKRVAGADLERLLFTSDDSVYFKKAIDYLIENHEALKAAPSKTPIVVDA